jgi:hypothetical protein
VVDVVEVDVEVLVVDVVGAAVVVDVVGYTTTAVPVL